MNKFLLCIAIFMAFYFTVQAQNTPFIDTLPWAPQGATWIYQVGNSPHLGIRVSGDTTILNKRVKKLKIYTIRAIWQEPEGIVVGSHINYVGEEYQYNSNDSVYMYDNGFQEFVFLYHSYPQAGDVWNLRTTYADCYLQHHDWFDNNVTVQDTLVYVNNIAYQAYNVYDHSFLRYEHVIPNIGSYKSFHPQLNEDSCHLQFTKYSQGGYGGLICYTDNIRGKLIIKTHDLASVDFIYHNICDVFTSNLNAHIVGIDRPTLADNKNDKFSIYPNPAHSALNIYSNGISFEEIMINDAVGRLVIQDKSRNDNINIQDLQSGLYIINIVDEYKQVSAFKFVKE